ncbi:MAG: MBL fold metallo-hydrolase, partial [Pseudomonadota bacterium]
MKRRSFFGLATLGGALLSGGVFAATSGSGANPYYTGPVSAHFDGRNFFNPGGVPPGSFGDLLRWQLGGGRTAWPDKYPSPFPPAIPSRRVVGDELRVTMVGHATMLVQTAGLNILTDPVWSDRVSPVSFAGPRRYNEPGIVFEELPPIDVVLISHNHYDHLDISTIRRLVVEHDPLIIAPLGNDTIIQEDVGTARVSVGDWGDATRINEAVRVHIEPCHHWSARGSADRRMALWAAFVIETPAGKIYHIGDTGYHDGINYR